VLVAGSLSAGRDSRILPLGHLARELTVSILGIDGKSVAVSIGAGSRIAALLAAPNGTIAFAHDVVATGAFAAQNVTAGANVALIFQSGFPDATPELGQFVAYAERSVTLGSGDVSLGGRIGIATAAAPGFGPQLTVGADDALDPLGVLFAPSVALGSLSIVPGDVEANSLQNNGGFLHGAQVPYPATMPPLPLIAASAAGTTNITNAAGQTSDLSPGSFGVLTVDGVVNLVPGTYAFASVTMGDHARLVALPGGPTSIAIAGNLAVGKAALIFPRLQPASALTIFVQAQDGNGGVPAAAAIGADSHVVALLAAPRGTLALGDNVRAIGAFAGFDIAASAGVSLQFQGGFPASAPSGRVAVPGGVPAVQASAPLVGPVPSDVVLHLGLQLPIQNSAALAALAKQLYDPTNSRYRHFLTPAQFAASFGASAAQYAQLMTFAQSQGLTIGSTYGNNLYLEVAGTVANLENAFLVNMNYYQRPGGGQFFSPDRIATIAPSGMSLIPSNVVGLNNYNLPENSARTIPSGRSTLTNIGSGPNGYLYGNDFRNIYVPDTTLTGTGQSVALVEFDDFFSADITQYENTGSPPLTNTPVQRVPVMGGNSAPTAGKLEVPLDIGMAISMAPALAHVFVYEGPNSVLSSSPFNQTAYDAEATSVFNTIANPPAGVTLSNQIRSSWFDYDGPAITPALTQFIMQGQSLFTAVGDFGAFVTGDPDPPPPPLNDNAANLMTLVGGTQSASGTGTATSCMVETTWNDPSEYTQGATGGGISAGVSNSALLSALGLSAYQTAGLATSQNNNGSATSRNMPDVAALADGIFVVINNGTSDGALGTSAAAPLWAGFTALINQQAAAGGMSLGFLNSSLYKIGAGANYGNDFHDIKDSSNNNEIGDSAFFSAVARYDLATGWGSPKIGLLNDLASPAPSLPPEHVRSGDLYHPHRRRRLALHQFGHRRFARLERQRDSRNHAEIAGRVVMGQFHHP
jgi:hypothetical protein